MTKKTVKRERTGYITRNVRQDFWTDPTFEDWTPEDKYFYLYLITSAETQLGIWRFNRRIAAVQLGYSPEAIESLLNRFTEYGEIEFSEETHEICLVHSLSRTIVSGGIQIFNLLVNEEKKVENKDLVLTVCQDVIDKTFAVPTVIKIAKYYLEHNEMPAEYTDISPKKSTTERILAELSACKDSEDLESEEKLDIPLGLL